MVQQHDLDQLQSDLEDLRRLMLLDRVRFESELQRLLDRAIALREDAAGGKFEPAIESVHDLLVTVARGVDVQNDLLERTAAVGIPTPKPRGG